MNGYGVVAASSVSVSRILIQICIHTLFVKLKLFSIHRPLYLGFVCSPRYILHFLKLQYIYREGSAKHRRLTHRS